MCDAEVGAHDIEEELQGVVDLNGFCTDVASTSGLVRVRSLLERVLLEYDDTPRAEVDLSPARQLVASLANNGQRHDRYSTQTVNKDACARGKPECPYCRYGIPHKLH